VHFPENSGSHSPILPTENLLDISLKARLSPIDILPVNLPRICHILPLNLSGFEAQKFA
jgi:hypothetical protein